MDGQTETDKEGLIYHDKSGLEGQQQKKRVRQTMTVRRTKKVRQTRRVRWSMANKKTARRKTDVTIAVRQRRLDSETGQCVHAKFYMCKTVLAVLGSIF